MYADDTSILARNKKPIYTAAAIDQHLEKLDDWFVKWKIALNVSKTKAIYFANDQQTSLIRFLIEELVVPPTHHHAARQSASELQPLPLPPHRDSNHQNPAPQIVKSSTCHTGDKEPFWAMGPKGALLLLLFLIDTRYIKNDVIHSDLNIETYLSRKFFTGTINHPNDLIAFQIPFTSNNGKHRYPYSATK
ncbi:hypothetical protein AVEN_222430-1 [Araneus ventricosus]|uniref:Reverse transcriptase domain-containing protein n=1 Tax=Araneus ventricosus TaxID=182803 RepID=A0A4Y2J9J5_ARAVE|nr:hypothetical protein AVEN_222430-1 [Araneus ventricosus]